jgi:hypothetical protein
MLDNRKGESSSRGRLTNEQLPPTEQGGQVGTRCHDECVVLTSQPIVVGSRRLGGVDWYVSCNLCIRSLVMLSRTRRGVFRVDGEVERVR